jgi:hypothetical protein
MNSTREYDGILRKVSLTENCLVLLELLFSKKKITIKTSHSKKKAHYYNIMW